MDRIAGTYAIDIGGGKFGFRDENLPLGLVGTDVTALWLNQVQEEILATIEAAGFAGSNADWKQLVKAIRSQRTNYFEAAGTANAITIAPALTFSSLAELVGVPLRIKASLANTAAAVTIKVNDLAAVNCKRQDGSNLAANDWRANVINTVVYNGAEFRILGPSFGEITLPYAIATPAQAVAATLDNVLMTPLQTKNQMAASGLGIGQTWQTVTRVTDYYTPTVYQNTTGRPIACAGEAMWQTYGGFAISPDNVVWTNALDSNQNDLSNPFFFIVPPGHYYKIYADLIRYMELR